MTGQRSSDRRPGMNGATIPRFLLPSLAAALTAFGIIEVRGAAGALTCDLAGYTAAQGLTAAVEQDLLVVSWSGQGAAELRARYAIESGQPVIRDPGIRKPGGQWKLLGRHPVPEDRARPGVRRRPEQ